MQCWNWCNALWLQHSEKSKKRDQIDTQYFRPNRPLTPNVERYFQELGLPVDQLSSTVAAASTYVGSLWGGWSKKDEKSTDKNNENTEVAEVKDSKRGSMTGGLGMMSSAFGKLSSFSKAAPLEQETENKSDETEEKESGGYFSAASLGAGLSSLTSSLTMENLYSATGATTAKDQEEKDIKAEKEEETEEKEDWSSWSKGAFSKVGQLTSNYSKGEYY